MKNHPKYKIPNYEIVAYCKSGGFGDVFRVREKSKIQLIRAVKIHNPSPFTDGSTKERFLREAEAISKLKHSSIVGYVTSGFTEDTANKPFIVMDYIEGEELLNYVTKQPYEERIKIMLDVLDAVSYAHSNKILHRDLKPSNIIIRKSDNKPIILDFGLAYIFEGLDSTTLTDRMVGTLGYIPTEVSTNPRLRSPKHDIYSCGVLLYQVIASRLPNHQEYAPLTQIDSALTGLDRIVQRALAAESSRYDDIAVMHDDLQKWFQMYNLLKDVPVPQTGFRDKLLSKKAARDKDEYEKTIRNNEKNNLSIEFCDVMLAVFKKVMKSRYDELANIYSNFEFIDYEDKALTITDADVIAKKSVFNLITIKNQSNGINFHAALQYLYDHSKWDWYKLIGFKAIDRIDGEILPISFALYSKSYNQSPNEILFGGFVLQYRFKNNKLEHNIIGYAHLRGKKNAPNLFNVNDIDSITVFVTSIIENFVISYFGL